MALSKILVPLDGSSLAEKALPAAAALASRTDATICLVAITGITDADQRRTDSETYLAAAAQALQDQDGEACFHVGSGHVAQGIAEIAQAEEVDLIVMTTRGRSGFAGGMRLGRSLGSVTDALIFESPVPVYVVRADTAPDSGREAQLPSGVIVPLDGSELAETALNDAIELARGYRSAVYLLRVIDEGADQIEADRAAEYLRRIAARLQELDIHSVPEVAFGNAGEAIVRALEQRPDCLVVLTTRGNSGLSRWVRGSVADWLIRHAPGPVVVVPPKEQALLGPAIH